MAKNCQSGFANTTDDESARLCYDNFPHYEGIKNEVKEELTNVITKRDFEKLLTLLIPSTTNILLLLYAASEDLISLDPFYPEITNTVYGSSWSFSSEILLSSGLHDEFASIVKELWSSSTFTESLVTTIDSCPQLSSSTAPAELVSPGGTEEVAEDRDGSAGVIGEPRDKGLLKDAAKGEASLCGGPQAPLAASYADVAAGRQAVSLPKETVTTKSTDSAPKRGLVLADFIAPKYKKRGRARKRSSRQSKNTVKTPAPADDQLSTVSFAQSADEAAGDGVTSLEAAGGDISSVPEETSRRVPASPPLMQDDAYSEFSKPYEWQYRRCGTSTCTAALFLGKVQQLEEAGRWYAERLAVGELQPDPAAIFYHLMPPAQRRDDTEESNSCNLEEPIDEALMERSSDEYSGH